VPLQLSTTSVTPGTTVTGVVTYQNVGNAPATLATIYVTSRPPGGTNNGGPFDDFAPVPTNITLQPGASYQLTASRLFQASDPTGSWYAYTTYSEPAGVFHDGPDLAFTVSAGSDAGSDGGGGSLPIVKGVNEHPIWYDTNPGLYADLDYDAGVQATRADVPWWDLEPNQGTYAAGPLANLDTYMTEMSSHGIGVTLIAVGTPAWASASGDAGQDQPPSAAHYGDFANFAAFLANRYANKGLEAIEVWNEPAGSWAWAPSGDDGIAYTALLKATYPAIKAAAADAGADIKVLGVSLFSGGQDPRDQTLLTNIYAQGGAAYFDIMSVHIYPGQTNPASVTPPYYVASNPTSSIFGLFQAYALPIMQAAGDGSRTVWVNETGVETGSTGAGATEQEQAAAITDCFTTFESGVLPANIQRVYWYELIDTEGQPDQGWGLVNDNGNFNWTDKPSFAAYQAIVP
jgi:hypothetical protein